jgi:hypothetical protein
VKFLEIHNRDSRYKQDFIYFVQFILIFVPQESGIQFTGLFLKAKIKVKVKVKVKPD